MSTEALRKRCSTEEFFDARQGEAEMRWAFGAPTSAYCVSKLTVLRQPVGLEELMFI
jgi:hypothetical protein